jgi:CHAT domain-containing protein
VRDLYALITTKNQHLPGETEAQMARRLARAEAAYNRAAVELSRKILGPVAGQLHDKRLLVVADGALHYVPFAALPEPETAQGAGYAPSNPLVMKHEVVNLPSASVLAVLRQQELRRPPAPKAVAVLADPVFASTDSRLKVSVARSGVNPVTTRPDRAGPPSGEGLIPVSTGLLTRSAADIGLSRSGTLRLPRLPFTRREADAIMAVTPDGMGLKALDFNASWAMATSPELAQYRIVHFATHGLLDSRRPELSGLVLSLVDKEGRPQDGFLQLQDIYNMNLRADLVVLSSCETGLGKEVNGEGLIGLTRGFMYAGATRVVSTLWEVNDLATAKLMQAFYTSLKQPGKRPAQSLREAQLSLLRQRRWSAPYYWAGFTIQGEWK